MLAFKVKTWIATLMAGMLLTQGCRPCGPTTPGRPNTREEALFKTLVTAKAALEAINVNASAFLIRNGASVNGVFMAYNTSESAFVLYARKGSGDLSVVQADVAALTAELVH